MEKSCYTEDMAYKKFRGSASKYTLLHNQMREVVEKPDACYLCKTQDKPLDLANLSQKYLKVVSDWAYMCRSCHRKYDSDKYELRDNVWYKKCTRCSAVKSLGEFYYRKGVQTKNGKKYPRTDSTSWCKICTWEWSAAFIR